MIDLHIHTTHSDGSYSPLEILQKAQQENLDIISITDHNQISAYDELENVYMQDYYKGKIIVGTELKCVYNHMPVEILAYGFERSKMKETPYITTPQKLYIVQSNYLDYIKKKGKQIGLFFDKDLHIPLEKLEFASAVFERELWKDERNVEKKKKHGINMKMPFYREAQSNPESIFYIDETKDYPKVQDVIDEIHKVKGLAFLAHLYEYPLYNHETIIRKIIKEFDLDGIECCHSSFTNQQSEFMIGFCKKQKLYMSGGSDYHGKAKPKVKFARAINDEFIPNELVQDWVEKIEYYN